ncbi:G-type lectin S-receptor-like serine/threonine-protein kinase LECRK3 [Cannabis sativa]|uniref:G-type lectin S-receptor-like serine/threonine-protein kinase LECRK3 n=1 Tax=Cannabis sativa TaxID=3483 RepID=UPI0029CA9366|nr:G-type lectin S-receptor-like serine/threonine-protein kinase LECRK3 [Cannabis sativa]
MFSFLHYLIILTFSIPSCSLTMAQNNINGTINIGATLKSGDKLFSSWLSSSGDFAFGFQQLPNNNKDLFLLAIWFNKLPEKTVVWYADTPNNPTPKGSKLELTTDRGLLLTDPQNQELWNSNPIISQVNMALFNDSGNFVLVNKNSEKIWESFSHPTDTLLPTQVLEKGDVVSSRASLSTNFSKGRFQLSLGKDGNFVLNSINLPSEFTNDNYYIRSTDNTGKQLVFSELGSLYVLSENNEIFMLSSGENGSSSDYFYRATLNFDGVFGVYSYPKNPTKGNSWSVVWSIPDNICVQSFVFGSSGACGYNRICRLNVDKRPVCECPRGFSLLDVNDEYRGCKPNFLQSCEEDSKSLVESVYTFQEIKDIDWPTGDYEVLQPYDTEKCKETCLNDCMCAVAIFRNNTCWKKKLPLTNGRVDDNIEARAFIKVRKSDFPLENPSSSSMTRNRNVLIIVGSVLLGTSLFVNFLLVGGVSMGFFFIYKKRVIKSQHDKEVSHLNLRCFTYKDLIDATDEFKEELGRGSFGIVYKGTLKDTNEHVAVKKLDRAFQDSEKEFKAEVNVIGHTHHKNLVRLVGFCEEGEQRLLVYEFMSNGALAGFLFGDMRPSWNQRIEIAMGVARGILYLHEECITQIIHCDIKPQNILLDESYNARIADFGLAKLLLINQSHTNTAIRGTKGYVAPEWFSNMPITVKVDVYSFGVLLLEIICCRRNVDIEIGDEEEAILVYWAYDCYIEGRLDVLVGNDMEAIQDMKSFERFLRVAIWCIQEDPSLRPSMKKVMLMLEGIVQVSAPPSPFLFGSNI